MVTVFSVTGTSILCLKITLRILISLASSHMSCLLVYKSPNNKPKTGNRWDRITITIKTSAHYQFCFAVLDSLSVCLPSFSNFSFSSCIPYFKSRRSYKQTFTNLYWLPLRFNCTYVYVNISNITESCF